MSIEDLARAMFEDTHRVTGEVVLGWELCPPDTANVYRSNARTVVLALAADPDPTDEPREGCCRVAIQLRALADEARQAPS